MRSETTSKTIDWRSSLQSWSNLFRTIDAGRLIEMMEFWILFKSSLNDESVSSLLSAIMPVADAMVCADLFHRDELCTKSNWKETYLLFRRWLPDNVRRIVSNIEERCMQQWHGERGKIRLSGNTRRISRINNLPSCRTNATFQTSDAIDDDQS